MEFKDKLEDISKRLAVVGGKSLVSNGSELTEEIASIGFDLDLIIDDVEG